MGTSSSAIMDAKSMLAFIVLCESVRERTLEAGGGGGGGGGLYGVVAVAPVTLLVRARRTRGGAGPLGLALIVEFPDVERDIDGRLILYRSVVVVFVVAAVEAVVLLIRELPLRVDLLETKASEEPFMLTQAMSSRDILEFEELQLNCRLSRMLPASGFALVPAPSFVFLLFVGFLRW